MSHCSDAEAGIRRLRSGSGFRYVWPDGSTLTDKDVRARIDGLAVPPAWTAVWIAPRAECHLQSTGKDVRGRKQYRYHPAWTAERDGEKYSTVIAFADALPKLRRTVEADMRTRGVARETVLATVVWLLDNTMIRVGNSAYARDNRSYGATTLRNRHVSVDGAALRFRFSGKSGRAWDLRVSDRRVARVIKDLHDLPGQHLFQYVDDLGAVRQVASQDVNAYIRDAATGPFSSKHFRTWGGTVHAALLFAEIEPPATKRAMAVAANRVVDAVAARLGNTRTVCRACYMHPLVTERWRAGRLAEDLSEMRRQFRRTPSGLERSEYLVLRWLQHMDSGSAVPG